jgi:hypothetical protein
MLTNPATLSSFDRPQRCTNVRFRWSSGVRAGTGNRTPDLLITSRVFVIRCGNSNSCFELRGYLHALIAVPSSRRFIAELSQSLSSLRPLTPAGLLTVITPRATTSLSFYRFSAAPGVALVLHLLLARSGDRRAG